MSAGIVVVTGAGGLLGRDVLEALAAAGRPARGLSHSDLDVSDASAVGAALRDLRPSAVVHCAAMTDVDRCEREPAQAWAANASYAGNVAAAAADVGAEVVAVSTDFVFDGEKGSPYTETDPTNPIQHYGRSKLGGEVLALDANPRCFVVRSCSIYGRGGKSFLSKLFDYARGAGPLRAVADQTRSPTYSPDLAQAILRLLGGGTPYGVYHVTNAGSCTLAEAARLMLAEAGVTTETSDISSRELGWPAPRPSYSALENRAWREAGLEPLRAWQEAAASFAAGAHARS